MARLPKRLPVGIRARHSRSCSTNRKGTCDCSPRFEASAYSKYDSKKVRKSFGSLTDARSWRAAMVSRSLDAGLRAPTASTFAEASALWLELARSGAIRTRSGDHFKPGAIRGYEQAFRIRLNPAIGAHKVSEITRPDLQRLVSSWQSSGLSPSSIRNTINAVRTLYRNSDLLVEGAVESSPTVGLRLPAVRGRRERIATPDEAAALLDALPATDRALWATALYAGLRLGEIQSLDWSAVDLAGGTIEVRRSFDQKAGFIEPKSRAGKRRVPIASILRELLVEHKVAGGGAGDGLVFGRPDGRPFSPSTVHVRARRHWVEAGLEPIGLHECRHTCASYFIAAGVNAKTLSTFLGHANIATTLDRYGHLFPGSEAEAAGLLDAYLERASSAGRIAQLD